VFEGREALFIDHVHYTVGGVELLAQNYTQFLIEQSFMAFQGEDEVVK
jgi:hypothetical protein